jgi:hypothetical protein
MTSTELGRPDDPLEASAIAAQLAQHVSALDDLDTMALPAHVDFYQRVHTELQHALTDIDDD